MVIGGHFGGGDHFDGGDHFGGGTGSPVDSRGDHGRALGTKIVNACAQVLKGNARQF